MSFLSNLFKKKINDTNAYVAEEIIPQIQEVEHIELDLPEGEIVSLEDGILDTTSLEAIEKFKHNLSVLIKKAKDSGKLDKFMLIREDDFFPWDGMWQVASKDTCMEKNNLTLSIETKKQYAIEKAGINNKMNGITLPVSDKELYEALKKVDKYLGALYFPVHFRSTKHFTVNTPLAVTGDYNSVDTDRNFIVMDDIKNFLESGYGYSMAYHDAYLDVAHEPLKLSDKAVILINQEKYEVLKNDLKLMEQLNSKKVIIFKGDETLAINMVLSELGVLPSQMGYMYANYDNELKEIIDRSIKELAHSNGLYFDKSHAGKGGHFTSYYDDKNHDYDKFLFEFVDYLISKFPEYEKLITYNTVKSGPISKLIDMVGTNRLLEAIDEYNRMTMDSFNKRYEEYKKDRENITPEIHEIFKTTIKLINKFYEENGEFESMDMKYQQEEIIRRFMQGDTVKEQLEAAKLIMEMMKEKDMTSSKTL